MPGARLHPIVNGMMEETFKIAVDSFFEKVCRSRDAAARARAQLAGR